MQFTARGSARITAILLISVVITQLVYIGLSSAGMDINRPVIWTTEAAAFLGIAVFALVPLARESRFTAVWAAISIGGILNVIQVGMGLAMFGPLQGAGEPMAPAFQAVLSGAFFLYFAGKFLFGFASLAIGVFLLKSGKGTAKPVGALAFLAGLGAAATNLAAMAAGMEALYPAGAAGTAAALFLAISLLMVGTEDTA